MPVFSLDNDQIIFPHPSLAQADGLLAVGGDLSVDRLILAYRNGIFPWFNEDDPPLWWSPPMRAVLFLDQVKISKSMRKELKDDNYSIRINTAFSQVIENCKKVREKTEGTWITPEFISSYTKLHELGMAHSVETYYMDELVGGLYGLTVGDVFCGESMFTLRSNASKIALIHLCRILQNKNYSLIDCQISNPHLESMGSTEIPRSEFLNKLYTSIQSPRSESF